MAIPGNVLKRLVAALLVSCGRGSSGARLSGVKVGDGTRIYTRAFGSEPWLISIGANSVISYGVRFITHDASGDLFRDGRGRRYRFGRIDIGNNVFVGAGAFILPGVTVGNDCVIGAGSVLTKSLPDGSVVAGNPARLVKTFSELRSQALSEWACGATDGGSRVSSITRAAQLTRAPMLGSDRG